ncbi:hypothetical protein NBZ79_11755 [Sneathiella marina]|uniref:Ribbon-helix-helix protein CopG domain-containing protein n=1 Tax=Sneathiella marina TaxID=2950108 RepID=A0ABY4W1W0_9PROT|nr:hypothetical protein [Sneathiella marina]USG59852.1 hypothetical protein NBZ79_11755 [Sneathiella marina]
MKAAFLTSSLIAPKGKALPASRSATPTKLLDDESNRQSGVSRIYERVREYADPHEEDDSTINAAVKQNAENETAEDAIILHEDETVSIAAEDDIYDFSKPAEKEEEQSVFDRIREQKNDVDPAEPISPLLEKHAAQEAETGKKQALSNRTPVEPLPVERYTEIATEVSKLTKDKLGRIRISVRMAPKDHLQLKLIAAHTQMSAQAIFETALEEYVSKHGSSILPESCACVLDKSSL